MTTAIETLFTPAEFATLPQRDLSKTICVVFDVFRATSTIVTALANGAEEVIPVAEISDALEIRRARPEVLLAGERDGLRVRADQKGGIDFDLGNSPREFTVKSVSERTIALTTTNGSRALRACANAQAVLAGSFLNLQATANYLRQRDKHNLILVCSGTHEQAAFEDILGAGALIELVLATLAHSEITDSTVTAFQIYQQHSRDLMAAVKFSRNGRRLLAMPELSEDVSFCLQRDTHPLVAKMENDAIARETL